MKRHYILLAAIAIFSMVGACSNGGGAPAATTTATTTAAGTSRVRLYSVAQKGYIMSDKVIKSEAEWRRLLTPEQYHVTREQGTERAYTGITWNNHEKGIYRCICCGNDLYSSDTKYESGTGWPSFWEPVAPENVTLRPDNGLFTKRTEVVCSRCGAHLGHVFDDGPKPTGLRYCMNSAAMQFVKTP
ncbi:peptide-methionine (R)-S-oxide reductase MsrB [Oryzomonas japonica]|nr:peptide-methionine (R)-S-oxide reductase MsrB [Oryzomonas japonica]